MSGSWREEIGRLAPALAARLGLDVTWRSVSELGGALKAWKEPVTWTALSAEEKLTSLWEVIGKPATDEIDPMPEVTSAQDGAWVSLTEWLLDIPAMVSDISHDADLLPPGLRRPRQMYRMGTFARVLYVPEPDAGEAVSGLLADEHQGIIRFSEASPIHLRGHLRPVVPALAWKVPVSGLRSRDVLLEGGGRPQRSPDGQVDWNIFRDTLSNRLVPVGQGDDPTMLMAAALAERLGAAADWLSDQLGLPLPTDHVRVDEWFTTGADGVAVPPDAVRSQPYLYLEPSPELRVHAPRHPLVTTFWASLATIDASPDQPRLLWRVWAGEGGQRQLLGQLFLIEPFRTSRRGDEQVYFRHHLLPASEGAFEPWQRAR